MFDETAVPVQATLSNWMPKCNNEMERRVRLNFEVPLNEAVINALPEPLQRLAAAISRLDDGITEGTLSTEFQESLEIYEVPDTPPVLMLENVQLQGLHIFRPTPKDGPTDTMFLTFSTTVRAEGPFGDKLVAWALRMLRSTVYLKAYEVQLRLKMDEGAAVAA